MNSTEEQMSTIEKLPDSNKKSKTRKEVYYRFNYFLRIVQCPRFLWQRPHPIRRKICCLTWIIIRKHRFKQKNPWISYSLKSQWSWNIWSLSCWTQWCYCCYWWMLIIIEHIRSPISCLSQESLKEFG